MLTNWRSAGAEATPLDLVKVSLTTIGGIGGTGYLVIKYRERASTERAEKTAELARKDVEQEKAEQKLLSAVQQLGSESPQVRIAGVYSLADVADTYRGNYRQRVVDILCGYLRMQRGEWKTIANGTDGQDESPEEKVYESRDGAVESTVLEVLRRHLRKRREVTERDEAVTQEVEDDQLWCDCTIDLHGAVISERIDFSGATFGADIHAQGTQFRDDVDFKYARFSTETDFSNSTFKKYADFRRDTFIGGANFQECHLASVADFRDAAFKQKCNFDKATTGITEFSRTKFQGAASFLQT